MSEAVGLRTEGIDDVMPEGDRDIVGVSGGQSFSTRAKIFVRQTPAAFRARNSVRCFGEESHMAYYIATDCKVKTGWFGVCFLTGVLGLTEH